ncbi:MAG: hypothetical protein SFV32_01190 [Opitutaceae bacterium]|nr:hypothetical protein [Opitutaceae bacterium]
MRKSPKHLLDGIFVVIDSGRSDVSRMRKIVSMIVVGSLVAFGSEARASATAYGHAYGEWRSGRIRGGGYIQNLVQSASEPNRLYAYVDVSGAFRSDDAGESWRMIHSSLPSDIGTLACRTLEVDPRNADHLLYACGTLYGKIHGIFRSEDGGQNWRQVADVPFLGNEDYRWSGTVLARDPANPDRVVAATAGAGVFVSDDAGKNWRSTDAVVGSLATDLDFDPSVAGRVWLCAQEYRPPVTGIPPGFRPWAPLKGGLWRSDDSGATWVKVLAEGPEELVVRNGRIVGIFRQGASLHASEDGRKWIPLVSGLGLDDPGRVDDLSFTAANPNAAATPSNEQMSHRIHAITTYRAGIACANYEGTLFLLEDNADKWSRVELGRVERGDWWGHVPGDKADWIHFGKAAGSLIPDATDPTRLWMTDWYAAWRSDDLGRNWQLKIDGIETTVLHCVLQDPSNPRRVFLGMADNGVYLSHDSGATWALPSKTFNNAKCLALSPSIPEVLYGSGTLSGTWIADSVFISRDSGENWDRMSGRGLPGDGHTYNSVAAHPTRPGTVFVAAAGPRGGVYFSNDFGETFSLVEGNLPAAASRFENGIWNASLQLAVGADDSLVSSSLHAPLLIWSPSTREWTAPETAPDGLILTVVADPLTPGRFAAAGPQGVHRSDDGGRNWKLVLAESSRHVAFDSTSRGRIVVGTRDGVVISVDGGDSWTELDRSLPNRVNGAVAYAGDRVIYGSNGNGIFHCTLPARGDR